VNNGRTKLYESDYYDNTSIILNAIAPDTSGLDLIGVIFSGMPVAFAFDGYDDLIKSEASLFKSGKMYTVILNVQYQGYPIIFSGGGHTQTMTTTAVYTFSFRASVSGGFSIYPTPFGGYYDPLLATPKGMIYSIKINANDIGAIERQ